MTVLLLFSFGCYCCALSFTVLKDYEMLNILCEIANVNNRFTLMPLWVHL